ncbi:MAG TPA: LuxR C-terminal-related transcriptional regulator [Gemmatimonadaceae bacterium]|nr:LuxR C-terminal-related transcriptional regulator [Gemmatimonadaceae bacterium]
MRSRHSSAASAPLMLEPSAHASGRRALADAAWSDARRHLETALATRESADVLEDLALAAWWLDDSKLVFDSRERAYSLYRAAGDALGAARVAIWLVWDSLAFRGDFAVASGWLERARSLLAEHQRSVEYGWLLIREGEVALFRGHDPNDAIRHATAAAHLGRELSDPGVEFTALALEGLARVNIGDISGGMRRLDEATIAATAGEMRELHAVGVVCCWQIFACERVRDYDRAAQWCARVQEFARRWGSSPLTATCRTQYAGVLIWSGEWAAAEDELTAAAREFERGQRPSLAAPAFARLGELRLRQGKLDEAKRLFEQAGSVTAARIGLAEVMVEQGNPAEAVALLEQLLKHLGAVESTLRATALEVLVRAYATLGQTENAAPFLEELEHIAEQAATDPLRASALAARAVLLRAFGELSHSENCYERAIDLFARSGAPFETARARAGLAELYVSTGREESAEREARLAAGAFEALGAAREASRAQALLESLDEAPVKGRAGLTERQIEILRLVAKGMSNGDIAARLSLSEHTVKRHVANLLMRLALHSRAAAAAYAAKEGLL